VWKHTGLHKAWKKKNKLNLNLSNRSHLTNRTKLKNSNNLKLTTNEIRTPHRLLKTLTNSSKESKRWSLNWNSWSKTPRLIQICLNQNETKFCMKAWSCQNKDEIKSSSKWQSWLSIFLVWPFQRMTRTQVLSMKKSRAMMGGIKSVLSFPPSGFDKTRAVTTLLSFYRSRSMRESYWTRWKEKLTSKKNLALLRK